MDSPTSSGLDSLAGSRIGANPAHIALIERDQAWKLAAQAFGRARAGHGSALLLQGPSGIGKSGLIAAISALAGESGMQMLTAAGRRLETEFPFGVVLQLVEYRLRGAEEDKRATLLSEAARHATPLLATERPKATSFEPSFDRLHGLYRLCAHLAAASPVALVVDDADLADPPSLRFLLYLTERLETLPIALVLSSGTVAPRRAPELLGEIARHPLTTRCRLEPLSGNGTARLVAKRWLSGAADEAAQEIHRASGGNPFLVDALAAALAARDGEVPATLVRGLAPAGVAEWAIARAADLDARGPRLLSAIAVLGPDCELRHAAALASFDPEAAAEIVDGLMDIEILAPGDNLSFAQPVISAGIASAQAPGERAASNRRAARLLAAEDASPERVARHLLLTTRTGSGWTVDALCVGAAVALGRAAPSDAIRYLRRALEEPPPPRNRAHVVLELGRAEAMAGEPQAAVRLHDGIEHLTEAPEHLRAALRTGRTLFALGRPQQALAVFERGLQKANDADPDLAGRLRAGHATAVWVTELPNGGGRQLAAPPAAADTPGDRALLALHAMKGAIRGMPCADVRALAERALARGALLDDETADGLTYYLAAGALAFAEDLQTAEAALTAAVHDAQSRGSMLGFATASHVRAMVILMRGRLVDAAVDACQALAVEPHGWRFALGGTRVVLANTLIERGDLGSAGRQLDAAESAPGEADPFRLALLSARGRLRLLNGQAEEALEDFLACGALADQAGATNPAVAPWRAGAGLAHAAIGDWSEAERLVESELALAKAFGAPGPVGRALRALASIREPEPALHALEAAVETLQGSQAALDRAYALVDFGAALRRSGRRRDARAPLKQGLELALRCGADVLAARAMRETKVAGARPRRTALHGLDALTTRERQVASLAADGLSNREIAETLVVTLKTVEWHLQHSYRKLGLSSRKQLSNVLGADES